MGNHDAGNAATYSCDTAAQTITTAASLAIVGAPIASTNVTITTPLALWVQAGNVLFAGNLTVTGTTLHTGSVTHADAADLVLGTTTGTKIGTGVTQKLGFWNAAPVVQPAGATQAAPAAYATGAFGLDSNANMQALYDLVVAMRTALVNTGIIKGAA